MESSSAVRVIERNGPPCAPLRDGRIRGEAAHRELPGDESEPEACDVLIHPRIVNVRCA